VEGGADVGAEAEAETSLHASGAALLGAALLGSALAGKVAAPTFENEPSGSGSMAPSGSEEKGRFVRKYSLDSSLDAARSSAPRSAAHSAPFPSNEPCFAVTPYRTSSAVDLVDLVLQEVGWARPRSYKS
jgi:hypothetical protein